MIATIQWVLPLDHLLFQAPFIFPTLQIGKNGSRIVAWLSKLLSVRVWNRKHMSIKALSPAVLNSSSPQCLRSSVLPGAKAVRKGCEDQHFLTIMYLKNYFLNYSTANRTHPQVWLHFFFLKKNFPCFYVGKICLITQLMHIHILGVKYPNNTAADKEGRKIPLGSLLQPHSSLISASNTVNSMARLFQTFPMYLHTYMYIYKYAYSHVSMVKTFRIPPWDVRHFSVAALATSPAPSQAWEGVAWSGEGDACIGYLLLHNKPPYSLSAQSNEHVLSHLLRVRNLEAI